MYDHHRTNIELLSDLVGPRTAKRLYRGTLVELFASPLTANRLERRIYAARELARRLIAEELRAGDALTSPHAVKDYLRLHFAGQERESFVVLFLDSQHRLLIAEELFRGTLAQTAVHPREVVKQALLHNCAAVILAHNHPSGVAEPSRADELLTQALKHALGTVDIRVLDHFVVAGSAAVSLAERGLV